MKSDESSFAKGLFYGLIISVPIWALIVFFFW
jgi:hypothetical protein